MIFGLNKNTIQYNAVAYRGGLGGFKPPLKFQSFDKAKPNSYFRGKYKPNKNTGFTHLQLEWNP
jgi:hypothetical protein